MSEVDVTKGVIDEDTSPYFWWRWVTGFGVAFTRASIEPNGITLRVFNLSADDPNQAILTLSALDPTTTTSEDSRPIAYDTLQTAGWDQDAIGYSHFYMPSIASLPTNATYGGCVLRFEFEAQLVAALGGGIAMKAFECKVRPRKSG